MSEVHQDAKPFLSGKITHKYDTGKCVGKYSGPCACLILWVVVLIHFLCKIILVISVLVKIFQCFHLLWLVNTWTFLVLEVQEKKSIELDLSLERQL